MKFHSKPIAEHTEVPLADDGRWEQLIAHWTERQARSHAPAKGRSACYVVSVHDTSEPTVEQAQLRELLGLVHAQGDRVVGHELLRRRRPDPRTYVGKGTAEAIAARASEAGATLLIIDAELSPSQTRNLEDATGFAIADREGVILNVFSRHANTRKARIQVEIAQLEYLRPRIRGIGLDMDQQAGGLTQARGPGETASELLARQLDGRLVELRRHAAKLERAGQTQRKGRAACRRVALVGYTNAGKTSLMNALTDAGLSAQDMPFETLDTTSRCLTRHGGDVVISDTVGFIRRLPRRLLSSFETTLAELREADLLAVVIDLSDPEWRMHVDTTTGVLARIGAGAVPRVYVYNKRDRVVSRPSDEELRTRGEGRSFVVVSSEDAGDVAELRELLIAVARHDHRRARVFVPYEAAQTSAAIYARCRVLASEAGPTGMTFTLEAEAHVVEAILNTRKQEMSP